MTVAIATLFVLLAIVVVLFATEVVPVDVTGVLLLAALYATGLVSGAEIFSGFGSGVVVFLASLFVVSTALVRTGALDVVERQLARLADRSPHLLLPSLLIGTTGLSAFLSNTATVAALLPLATSLARRGGQAPSRLLMPLAFGSILGGSATLIGTSTNVVVSETLPRFGEAPLSLFELAPVALPAIVIGSAYLIWVAPRLLPSHGVEVDDSVVREYLSEVVIPADSPWVGKTPVELDLRRRFDLEVLGVIEGDVLRHLRRTEPLAPEQTLLVKADHDALLRVKQSREVDLAQDRGGEGGGPLRGADVQIHELMLAHNSRLARRTLRELDFRNRYGASVLALFRRGRVLRRRLADLRLQIGDVLLVQGSLERLQWLIRSGDLVALEKVELPPPTWRAWFASAAFVLMLLAGGLGWAPFAVAAFVAAGLLVVAGCLSTTEAYAAIDWRILVMIGCLLGLASAMETSGAASYLAGVLVRSIGDLGPLALLAAFYLLTVVLTQPMSNQAAALVVLPLAVSTASGLELNPRPFAIAVCLAASCSFVTPLEPAALLVYGPGRYRFRDYTKVGLPLTVAVLLLTVLLVPVFWPFELP